MYSSQGNLIVQQDSGLSVLETPEKLRIRTLIVDSDPDAVVRLQEIIRQDPEIDILGFCGNGNEALSVIRVARPDLMFLDVNLSGIDGFSLIEKLRGGPMPVVIFVTAYDKYALQAFEVSALDYLLKPFAPERVRKALQKMKALVRHEEKPTANNAVTLQRLAIRSGKKVFFLRPEEIHWIEAEGNSVRLHSGTESHTLKMSISALEAELDPSQFVRIHRSTIVNLDKVRWLEPSMHGTYKVILENGQHLVLSRKDKLHVLTGKTIRTRE